MELQISLPLGSESNIKNLVFIILTREYPLKLIQLTNFIRKRYGRQVTFQAVRKAVLELVNEGVVIKTDNVFLINKEWVIKSKKIIDGLYESIYEEKSQPIKIDSIGEDTSVFTFSSINEMMKFWEDLIDYWFKKFKKGDYNINCFQGAHGWEALLHPDAEMRIMKQLKDKGIKSFVLFIGNNPLDKVILKFYKDLGLQGAINKSSSQFERAYYVATYGDWVVQTQYPLPLVNELENFFKKNKELKDFNLSSLSEIANKKVEIKLSVTKNLAMAKQINRSIISELN